jgi:O-antigen ligase
MIGEHPFGIGVGESSFREVYPQYAVSGIESVMHAHQILLQLALELGIGGVLVFFAAILSCVTRGLGNRSTAGFAAALCGALTMGCFDHLWYEKTVIALIFILAALTVKEEATA